MTLRVHIQIKQPKYFSEIKNIIEGNVQVERFDDIMLLLFSQEKMLHYMKYVYIGTYPHFLIEVKF